MYRHKNLPSASDILFVVDLSLIIEIRGYL